MINSVLYPSWSKEHFITIKAETSNPITEHKIDILNRLDQNKKIGRGGAIPKTVLKKQIQLKQKIKGKRNLPKF